MVFHKKAVIFIISNIRVIFFISVLNLIGGCNSPEIKNRAEVKFNISENDFGQLKYGSIASCSFSFTNIGKKPLIIQHVRTTCGCTVAKWPKNPIKPDEVARIKIKYDASSPGVFFKTITVFYNGKDSPKILTIKGRVKSPAKGTTAL